MNQPLISPVLKRWPRSIMIYHISQTWDMEKQKRMTTFQLARVYWLSLDKAAECSPLQRGRRCSSFLSWGRSFIQPVLFCHDRGPFSLKNRLFQIGERAQAYTKLLKERFLLAATKRTRLRVQAAKMSFLHVVAGLSLREALSSGRSFGT